MAKYVNNAYSPKMIKEDNLAVAQKEISEQEFMEESHKSDVQSFIGHEDTAKLFNLKNNRGTIVLHEGDVLFMCELNNTTGTRLPEGITRMEQIPDGFTWRFLKMVCFKKPDDVEL